MPPKPRLFAPLVFDYRRTGGAADIIGSGRAPVVWRSNPSSAEFPFLVGFNYQTFKGDLGPLINSKSAFAVCSFCLLFTSSPSFGGFEIVGGDLVNVEGTSAPYTVCRMTKDWEIFSGPNPNGEAGGDGISVFTTEGRQRICDPTSPNRTPVLKAIGNFMAVRGPLLILDTGTGPDIRGIHVYDLMTGKEVYTAAYVHDSNARIESGKLIHWTAADQLAKAMNCKFDDWPKEGIGANEEVSVDLGTLKVTKTGQKACARRQ